jgi:hypothetical protein
MKKLLLFAALCSSAFVACTAGEVGAGAVGVGVGIGVGSHYGRGHGRHYGGPDYGHGRGRGNLVAESVAMNDESNLAETFAAKHHISVDAAKKIQTAFAEVPDKGLESFSSIGLKKSDLTALASHSLPSADTITAMSAKLNLSEAQTRDMLVSVNQDFTQQAADVNSDYWQSCMDDGAWKTPENSFCQQTSWEGCSPETGASMCY